VVYAPRLVPLVALPLKILTRVMFPATWICGLITGFIAKERRSERVSSEELKVMARLSRRTGGIKPLQEDVIENILSLESKRVKDVMTPRTVIFSLSEHLTLGEAYGQSNAWEHSRFPVYDADQEDIVGIVLTKDLFIALADGKKDIKLTELMRPVRFIAETARLNNVLVDFMGNRQKLFVVIDEYGGLSGIITLEDILEEILGQEIVDESDQVVDKRELARNRRSRLISGFPSKG
jgi:CBS domain containing-hemolysin-like protein